MTTTTSTPVGNDIETELAALERETAAVLRSDGRADIAERLFGAMANMTRRAGATVVVVGETKRGKSSLVNALLGKPGLSPVDADVATAAYILIRYSDVEFARVHRARDAGATPDASSIPDALDIPIDEVAEYATIGGNPGNVKNVVSIEVGLPLPLLREVTLIDTPGVSGLEAGHAELTLQALGRADALMFVIDPGGVMAAPELEFLRRASERVDEVILVMTKTDLYPGWQQVALDDTELLRRHAPRFAQCERVAVSSRLAERALKLGPGSDARRLRHEAGLGRLESLLLHRVVQRSTLLGMANRARACAHGLDAVTQSTQERVEANRAEPETKARLEAEQSRLAGLSQESANWRSTLEDDLQRLTYDRSDMLQREVTELTSRYWSLAGTLRKRDIETLQSQVMADLGALAGRLAEATAETLVSALERVLGTIDGDHRMAPMLQAVAGIGYDKDDAMALEADRALTATERLMTVMNFSSGMGIVWGLSRIGMGTALLGNPLVLPLAIGGGFAYLFHHGRRDASAQQEMRMWAQKQISDAHRSLTSDFNRTLIDIRAALRTALEEHIAQRQLEIKAAIEECKVALTVDADTRSRNLASAQAQADQLAGLQQRARSLLAALGAARGSAGATR